MACEFVKQLSKLRKSSEESVENTTSFNQFKEYMHVERHIEAELREMLRNVNTHLSKCLVLLCGSAGDGKSHLISYLKNSDKEKLLATYIAYNDATESNAPNRTAIETLAEVLRQFDDDHYMIEEECKLIIAINLGTLNNFIDSEEGKHYSKLRDYVYDNHIFLSSVQKTQFQPDSVFQHVSFSDYQVFTLREDGVGTDFLESLIKKIFDPEEANPFYQSYNNSCANCPVAKMCPVRHNYEFLIDAGRQKALINRVIEAVIEDKEVVSTREFLNLLYDLIVHPEFDYDTLCKTISGVAIIKTYIAWSTPMLLNEYVDISPLLNAIKAHSIMKQRDEKLDLDVMKYHSLENIEDLFKQATFGLPYYSLSSLANMGELGGTKPELKKLIYQFMINLRELTEPAKETLAKTRLKQFIKYLYYQNADNEIKLADLYDATQTAVKYWDGEFGDKYVCIDDSNERYWIVERLEFKQAANLNKTPKTGEIDRFTPTVKISFKRGNYVGAETVDIRIDYSLYSLIMDMNAGYRPTVQDKNKHTDFVSFVKNLIEFGDKAECVIIIDKDGDKKKKMVFDASGMSPKFKVE